MPRKYPPSRKALVYCLAWFLIVPFLYGCAGLRKPPGGLVGTGNGQYEAQGTPEWWKKKKNEKELVPGKGFKVPGVEGYFDDQGRPMDAPVVPASFTEAPKGETVLDNLGAESSFMKVKEVVGLGPDAQISRTSFAEGRKLYDQEKYSEAITHFKKAKSRAKNSEQHQMAMLMLAHSYMLSDQYNDAVEEYQSLLKKYPGTRHLDEVIENEWLIAQYWQRQGEKNNQWPTTPNMLDDKRPLFDTLGNSLKLYDHIRISDPTGPWADDALMATATAHFKAGRYSDAEDDFKLIRTDYPKSPHQFKAHILGLQSLLRKYQGPQYDPTPLEESEKLIKNLRFQFAGRLSGEERKEVEDLQAMINKESVNRDMVLAQYYEKGDNARAARQYYTQIAREYPDTVHAATARERLAKLDGLPDKPDERLGWLMEYLPESREKAQLAIPPARSDTILK